MPVSWQPRSHLGKLSHRGHKSESARDILPALPAFPQMGQTSTSLPFPHIASSCPQLSHTTCPVSPSLGDHCQREDKQVPGSKYLLTNREITRNKTPGGGMCHRKRLSKETPLLSTSGPSNLCYPASSPIQNQRPDQNRSKIQRCASQTGATRANKLHLTFSAHRLETPRRKRLLEWRHTAGRSNSYSSLA